MIKTIMVNMVNNDHQNKRKEAAKFINKLIQEGKYTIEEINYEVLMEFGSSKKFVNSFIEDLVNLKKAKIKEGIVSKK